jgi:two-component system, LytTR family, response regulator
LRTLIVDDEPWARQKLCELLKHAADVAVVGECGNGLEAVAVLGRESVDLVFLDVQMPGMDGLAVLEAVGPERMPAVVFVTAHDQYAVQAFEVNACDYLLKPFDEVRLQKALERARRTIRGGHERLASQLAALVTSLAGRRKYDSRLVAKSEGRVYFVAADEIDWIEAQGNYAQVHAGGRSYLLRETMASLVERLDPDRFFRVHRNAIVNADRIAELQPMFNGQYDVVLRDGLRLSLSRRYRDSLQRKLGRPF